MKAIPLHPHAPESRLGSARPAAAALRNLARAPHRTAFFYATLMLLFVSVVWTLILASPLAGTAIVTTVPPAMLHGVLFAGGFMPLFMAGFMYTAGPRWLDVSPPSAATLRWPVALHCAGVVLLVIGAGTATAAVAFGALLLAMSWTAVGLGYADLLRASQARDRLHARCIMLFWFAGIAAALLFAAALATLHYAAANFALWLLAFGFVVPITLTVAHRVLPFFTSGAVTGLVPYRPNWVLGLLLLGVLAFGTAQLAARSGALSPRPAAWLTLAIVAPSALALAALALRWGFVQSLRGPSLRLVAMLHLAFAWIPLALGIASVDAVTLLLLHEDASPVSLLPLHALTIGFLGSMLFAMATRVTSGHAGLAVVADGRVWVLFWLLQAAALLRLAVPLLPQWGAAVAAAAALLWTAVWGAWALRYLPILLRPRSDGRPG